MACTSSNVFRERPVEECCGRVSSGRERRRTSRDDGNGGRMFTKITTAKIASIFHSENEVAVCHSQQQYNSEGMEGGEASSFETVQGQLSEGELDTSLVNKTPPFSSSSSHPSPPTPSRPSSFRGVVSRPDWLPRAPLRDELPVPPSFLKEEMRARSASSGSCFTHSPSPLCHPSFSTEKRVSHNPKNLAYMNSLHAEDKQPSARQKKTDSPVPPVKQEKSSSPEIDNLLCCSFSSSRPTPVLEHPSEESRARMTLDASSTHPHSQLGLEVFRSSRNSEGGGGGLLATNTICHQASPSSCSPADSTQMRRRSTLCHPMDSSRGHHDHAPHDQGEASHGDVYTPDDGSAVGATVDASPPQPIYMRKTLHNSDLSHPLPFQGHLVHSSPAACTQSHSVGGGVLAPDSDPRRPEEEEKGPSFSHSSCISYSCPHPPLLSVPDLPATSISKTHGLSSLSFSPAAPPVSPSPFPSSKDHESIYWCHYPKGEREETEADEGRRKRCDLSSLQSGRHQDINHPQSTGLPNRHSTRSSPSSSPLLPVEVSSPSFSSSLGIGGESREISSSFLRRRSSERDDDDIENQMQDDLDVPNSYPASRGQFSSKERKKRFLNEARQNNSFSFPEAAGTSPRDSVMPVGGQPRDRGREVEEEFIQGQDGQEEGRIRMTKEEEEFLEIKRKFTREFDREGYVQKTSYVFDTSTGTATSEDQRRDHQEHQDGGSHAQRYPPHHSHPPNPSSSSSSAAASSSSHSHRRHSRWLRLFASRLICLGPREGKESFYRRDKTSSRQSGGRRRSVSQRIERGFHKISTRRSDEGGEKKAASYRKRFEESMKGDKDIGDISIGDRRNEREEEEEDGRIRYEDGKHTSVFVAQKSSPVFSSTHGNQKSTGVHSSSASYPFSPRFFRPHLSSSRDQEEGGHQVESEPHANTNDVDSTKKKRRRHRFRRHLRGGGGEGKNQFTGSTSANQTHHSHPVVCTANSRSVFPSPSPLVYSSSRQSPEAWCSFSSSSMRADMSREEDEGKKSLEESAERELYCKEERRDSVASATSSSRGGGGRLRRLRSKRHKDKKSKEERKVDVHHFTSGPRTPEDPSRSGENDYKLSRPNDEDRKEKISSQHDRIEGQQQIARNSSISPGKEKEEENGGKVTSNDENRNTDGDNDENKRRDSFYSIQDLSEPNYGELSFSRTDTPPVTSDEREQKENLSGSHHSVPSEVPQPYREASSVHTPGKREHSPQASSLEKISCRLDKHPARRSPAVEKCGESPYSHLDSKVHRSPSPPQRTSPQGTPQNHDAYHPTFPPSVGVFIDPSPETHAEEGEENQDEDVYLSLQGDGGVESLLDSMLAIRQERQRTGSTTSSALFPKRLQQKDEDLLRVHQEGEKSLSSVMAPSSSEVLSSVSAVHSPSSGSSMKTERKTSNASTSLRSPSSSESVSSRQAAAAGDSVSPDMESPAGGSLQGTKDKKAGDDSRELNTQVEREVKETSLSTRNTKDHADLSEPDEEDEEEEDEDQEEDSEDEEDEIEDGKGKIISRRRSHHHRRNEQEDNFFSQLDLSSEDLVEYVLKALEERRMAFNSRQHQAVLLQHTKKQSKKASWMRDFSRSSSKQVSGKNLSAPARDREEEKERQRSKGGERRRQEERKQRGKEGEETLTSQLSKSEKGLFAFSSDHQEKQGERMIEEEEDEVGTEDDDEGWDRQRDLLDLAEFLLDASVVCMARELVIGGEEGGKEPGQAPSRHSLRKSTPSSSKSGEFPRVYDKDGLSVWKKEFGAGRVLIRASFILPVTPEQYSTFASDSRLRATWDANLGGHYTLETLAQNTDVCRVLIKRIATVYPRDVVTLRARRNWCLPQARYSEPSSASQQSNWHSQVAGEGREEGEARQGTSDFESEDRDQEEGKKKKKSSGKGEREASADDSARKERRRTRQRKRRVRERLSQKEEEERMVFASCSCSIEHPDAPEQSDHVRMDIRVSAYIASPLVTPFGVWSEVTLFSEGDPKGWIPAVVSKALAVKILPSTVEKMAVNMLKHYNIHWDGPTATGYATRRLAAYSKECREAPKLFCGCRGGVI
ncbi:start domain-containing protein [Cystoisospora suis]|uniref:Start domain-containing protein n=1 Tax=Cystoisospora suis TaxID=483139 RepID=A0A2C6KJH6_9APIC|nr:start domain-containing protein [Cystoisospora suis]